MGDEIGTAEEAGPLRVAVHGCADCPLYDEALSECEHPAGGPEGRLADIFAVLPRACPLRRRSLTLRIAEGL